MAGAQSLIGGGELPGLQLVAWVLLEAGTIVKKQFNVSGVARPSLGVYTVTLASPMADANPFVVVRGAWKASQITNTLTWDGNGAQTTTNVPLRIYKDGALADFSLLWVGIYQ